MENTALVEQINKDFALTLANGVTRGELEARLGDYINDLIKTNFQKLISHLYRVDVSETKLTGLLQQHPGEDAGKLIAALMIERQLQKIEARKRYTPKQDPSPSEEPW